MILAGVFSPEEPEAGQKVVRIFLSLWRLCLTLGKEDNLPMSDFEMLSVILMYATLIVAIVGLVSHTLKKD